MREGIAPVDSAAEASAADPVPMLAGRSYYMLAVLALVAFFSYMDRLALAILVEPMKADLGLSDAQLGLLSGIAFAALYSVLGIPLARFADRSSRTRLLAICLFLWSVMTFTTGFARNFTQIFLARVGVGIGEAGCVPAAHSLIGDAFPRERRFLGISIFQIGSAIGSSAGLFLVGYLAERIGWRGALQAIGLASLPLVLLVFFTLPEPGRNTDSTTDPNEPALAAVGGLLKRGAFVNLVVAYGLGTTCTFGMTQWIPAFLVRSFDMKLAAVGAWSGLASVVSGPTGLLAGGLIVMRLMRRDTRWELWFPAITYIVATPIYVLMFLSPNALAALLLKTGGNFLTAMGAGVALAATQSYAEPSRRATAVSIMLFLSSLIGYGVGPFFVGVTSDLLEPTMGAESLRYALLIACALLPWASLHFWLGANRSRRDRVN